MIKLTMHWTRSYHLHYNTCSVICTGGPQNALASAAMMGAFSLVLDNLGKSSEANARQLHSSTEVCCNPFTAVDLLYKHVLYKQTHEMSTRSLGPIALFSVHVSFVISTLTDCMTFNISTARES